MTLAVLLSFLLAQGPTAATGSLSGRVFVESTRAPIAGARVTLMPTARPAGGLVGAPPQAVTAADGRYAFENLPSGEYRINVERNGPIHQDGPIAKLALVLRVLPIASHAHGSREEPPIFFANP